MDRTTLIKNLMAFESGIWQSSVEKQLLAKLYQMSLIRDYGPRYLELDSASRKNMAQITKYLRLHLDGSFALGGRPDLLILVAAENFVDSQIQRLKKLFVSPPNLREEIPQSKPRPRGRTRL